MEDLEGNVMVIVFDSQSSSCEYLLLSNSHAYLQDIRKLLLFYIEKRGTDIFKPGKLYAFLVCK